MLVSQVGNDRDEKGENDLAVGFEDGEEVVILEEAHGTVGHLQVRPTYALYYPFEQFVYQGL
jgi:hypothetical protein